MPIYQLSIPQELYELVAKQNKNDESIQATIRRLLKDSL